MRRLISSFALLFTLAACGLGDPPAVQADPKLDNLFAQLEQAPDAQMASPVEQAIRDLWAESGSPTVNILLERAAAAETSGDSEMALRYLEQASDLAPDYAEPWNRRANIAYRAEDYSGAVAAIQQTLKREPRHFGAMAGLGLIYEELGQQRAALEAFRAALAVHPNYQSALDGVDGRDA
jgi:tetratricopeptide (TPR) repeat protein